MKISKRQAKKTIAENYDLIEELKGRITPDKNRMEKNLLYLQIENRKTINKKLEKLIE